MTNQCLKALPTLMMGCLIFLSTSSLVLAADGPYIRGSGASKTCYYLTSSKTWANAKSEATGTYSADLATVDDGTENAWLATNSNIPYYQFWIGLHDIPNNTGNGPWKWSDGTAYSYDNWGPSEPNYVDEDCGVLIQNSGGVGNGGWNNFTCWSSLRGLIEDSTCSYDTDGDGENDGDDECPNDPDKTESGVCNCGNVDDLVLSSGSISTTELYYDYDTITVTIPVTSTGNASFSAKTNIQFGPGFSVAAGGVMYAEIDSANCS